jgi:uncharacterized protein
LNDVKNMESPMSSALRLRDNVDNDCYEAFRDDDKLVGVVVYKRIGDRIAIRHTVVEPQFRGSGLGTQMVRLVLDDLRELGAKLTNYCGFVADFIADNPDYQNLVNLEHPGVTLPRDKRGKNSTAPATHQ